MKVSIVLPSRGRPALWQRMVNSALTTARWPGNISVWTGLDKDDPEVSKYLLASDELHKKEKPRAGAISFVHYEPGTPGREMWNWLAGAAVDSGADFVMLGSDDVIFELLDQGFTTPTWDEVLLNIMKGAARDWRDEAYLVWGWDGSCGPTHATHPFLSRAWLQAVGKAMPSCCRHFDGDTFVTDIVRATGRGIYTSDIVTRHDHPKWRREPLDTTGQRTKPQQAIDYVAYRGPDGRNELANAIDAICSAITQGGAPPVNQAPSLWTHLAQGTPTAS